MGKLYEQMLKVRLEEEVARGGGLSDYQFGFRRKRSTIQAVERVVNIAEKAKRSRGRTKKLYVLVTVDVKNAFNSAA